MMEGYLLIDSNNLTCRVAYGYGERYTSSGEPTHIVHGFMDQLVRMRQTFPQLVPLIVWDGGYKERTKLSKKAVDLGVIPELYKANRDDNDPIKTDIKDQEPFLRHVLSTTNVPQVRKDGYEADDVIASYTHILKQDPNMTIVNYTVDKDYYQLIDDNVMCVSKRDGVETLITLEDYENMFSGLSPCQWVDVGALGGDTGDNIFGVPTCGEGTAIKLISEHHTYQAVIEACTKQFSGLRAEYSDLQTEDEINELKETRSCSKHNPYAMCYPGMKFTGVALAVEKKLIKKPKMMPLMISMFQDVVRLAYRLKKMKCDLNLPPFKVFDRFDKNMFVAACERFELHDIKARANLFSCDELR